MLSKLTTFSEKKDTIKSMKRKVTNEGKEFAIN